MPSTYSPNLRLELQATGENATTWGVNANNVFSRIEDAISSTVNLAMANANQTLTVVNGGQDQSRCMFINCTGANTATRTVTIPAASKMYIFRNATTGGFGITVTNGVNSIAVPNGMMSILMTDGTNIYYGNNVSNADYLYSTDAGATAGPLEVNFRDSSSPANNDYIGQKKWRGRNSIATAIDYVTEDHRIMNSANGAERGQKTVTVYGGSGTSASYGFDTTSFNGNNLGEASLPWQRAYFDNSSSSRGITFGTTDDFLNVYKANRVSSVTVRGSTTAGTGTYPSDRFLTYCRVGHIVFVNIGVIWSGHTGTGNLQITGGLPFTPSSSVTTFVLPCKWQSMTFAGVGMYAAVTGGSTTINIMNLPSSTVAGTSVAMQAAGHLYINGFYFVD